jgi:hypothetical protein
MRRRIIRGQFGLRVPVRGSHNGSSHEGSLGGSDRVVGHHTTAPKSTVSEYAPNENKGAIPSWRLAEETAKKRELQARVCELEAELQASQARVKELERTFITRKRTLTLSKAH